MVFARLGIHNDEALRGEALVLAGDEEDRTEARLILAEMDFVRAR